MERLANIGLFEVSDAFLKSGSEFRYSVEPLIGDDNTRQFSQQRTHERGRTYDGLCTRSDVVNCLLPNFVGQMRGCFGRGHIMVQLCYYHALRALDRARLTSVSRGDFKGLVGGWIANS